jgi:hypothetical protein
LTGKEEGALWASVKRCKGFSKISPEVRDKLLDWIANHKNVIVSPIAKDTLLVLNSETGEKERVGKPPLEGSFGKLHNLLIEREEDGGLTWARDANGNIVIYDTVASSTTKDDTTPQANGWLQDLHHHKRPTD